MDPEYLKALAARQDHIHVLETSCEIGPSTAAKHIHGLLTRLALARKRLTENSVNTDIDETFA